MGFPENWFAKIGWTPLPFQSESWNAVRRGESGIVSVSTGSGKTYSAYLAALEQTLLHPRSESKLRLLYITPLRALSRDIESALRRPLLDMNLTLEVMSRTGDTSTAARKKQKDQLPEILITTPESLSVLLSYPDAREKFSSLVAVIVDEWHDLIGTKRGVQTELCLATLRLYSPSVITWGLSATIGNIHESASALVGVHRPYTIVQFDQHRPIHIDTLLPESADAFPWSGHLGLTMLPQLLDTLDIKISTLLFTNTRNQAERWYQELTAAMPRHIHRIALHHGSIDKAERERIERGVKLGVLKWVVCTSSLDLGVDFSAVERVVQIGSAKGVARLMQRAGRSNHQPGKSSKILFVPTNALEIAEAGAYRAALSDKTVEPKRLIHNAFDVLIQHLVTLACGNGFTYLEALSIARSTASYQSITESDFQWCIDFITTGGKALAKYPNYKKVSETDGIFRATGHIARLHRMSIGTILSATMAEVKFLNGKRLGTVEEEFVSKMNPGDRFFFAGRYLELVTLKEMTAIVKASATPTSSAPSWAGGRLPISESLGKYLRSEFAQQSPNLTPAEQSAVLPIYDAQKEYSRIPPEQETLYEILDSSEGRHFFVFPFEGRFVHEGIAALWAFRFSQLQKSAFHFAFNDYGFEILAPENYPFQELFSPAFFKTESLSQDIERSLNLAEMSTRQFRGIAQIAGLVITGYPGERRALRHLQASSQLLFKVFSDYDPDNLLLRQARAEVLEEQLDHSRLSKCLSKMSQSPIIINTTTRPSPLAFPLMVERLGTMRGRLSTETTLELVERLKRQFTSPTRLTR